MTHSDASQSGLNSTLIAINLLAMTQLYSVARLILNSGKNPKIERVKQVSNRARCVSAAAHLDFVLFRSRADTAVAAWNTS